MKRKIATALLTSALLMTSASAAFAETEPNNTWETADVMFDNNSGDISNIDDQDWFYTTGGGTLYLDHQSFFGNTDMYVYNANMVRIGVYSTAGDEEVYLPYGTYYICVLGSSGHYALDWR
ncbi:hypothetical protein CBW65_22485 [Tumebacillus avium]|uniref:Uncharacterized protein n=1 Tax=Tumebacillus avium TaxID=1903704 RepID=A0A1Y0IVE4_9BACL|nr:hypothetical protein [Tumebacillus avium]ARU63455.1 hypothetical protein CBW65_22485 [Tumebacillus avium]